VVQIFCKVHRESKHIHMKDLNLTSPYRLFHSLRISFEGITLNYVHVCPCIYQGFYARDRFKSQKEQLQYSLGHSRDDSPASSTNGLRTLQGVCCWHSFWAWALDRCLKMPLEDRKIQSQYLLQSGGFDSNSFRFMDRESTS